MKTKAISIANSIIAAALTIVLLFSQGFFAVAADGTPSVIRSNAVNLTATEDELKGLEAFFGKIYYGAGECIFPINSKKISYEVFLNRLLTDKSGKSALYSEYFNSEALDYEQTPDPMKKFAADETTEKTGFYYRYTKENLDWILTKIFNVSPSVTSSFNPEEYEYGDGCYYYDGSFYVPECAAESGETFEITVNNWKQYENGRYTVDIENTSVNGSEAVEMAKAVVALKEISGVRRWTVYYTGSESGVMEALKNEPLVIGVDNNSFANAATAFITYAERARYYTTKESIKKLTENKPDNLQNAVYEYIAGGWDGSGYGIAAAMALSFAGKTDISLYQEGTGISFYKMRSPAQNKNFRSLINYYQLSQLCMSFSDYTVFEDGVNTAEEKEEALTGLTEAVKNNSPVIISCTLKNGSKTAGHTLVGCCYDKKLDGSHEITLVDPDDRGKHIYLTISEDFSQCAFKGSGYDNGEIISLGYLTADKAQSIIETGTSTIAERLNNKCIFIIEQNAKLTVTNADGQKLIYNETGFSGDMAYTVENYILSGNGHESDIMIAVENSESFTVENQGKTLDITVSGGNGIFCGVDGTNIETVELIPGEFTVKGKDMAYSISALSTEENVELINLRGGESKAITVASKNGVTVTSERKQNLRVALISSDGETAECDFQPQNFQYSVTAELIEEHVELEKTNHIRVLLFFVIFGVLVVAAAAVTAVIVRKKRKKNRKEKETE